MQYFEQTHDIESVKKRNDILNIRKAIQKENEKELEELKKQISKQIRENETIDI
jgi:hypothetical protein